MHLLLLVSRVSSGPAFYGPQVLVFVKFFVIIIVITSNNDDDVDPRLSLLCQVGDDVIRPCKICGGCQIRVPRSIHSINIVPYISTPICSRSEFFLRRTQLFVDYLGVLSLQYSSFSKFFSLI